MEIKVHQIECQHPFGPGIHVLVPPREMILPILDSLDLLAKFQKDTEALGKLIVPGKALSKTAVYKSEQEEGKDIFAVTHSVVKDDSTFELQAMLMMVEPGQKKLAKTILDTLLKEFPSYMRG